MFTNLAFQVKCKKNAFVSPNISGCDAYFSKPTYVLKPLVRANRLGYYESYNRKIFLTYEGVLEFKFFLKISQTNIICHNQKHPQKPSIPTEKDLEIK